MTHMRFLARWSVVVTFCSAVVFAAVQPAWNAWYTVLSGRRGLKARFKKQCCGSFPKRPRAIQASRFAVFRARADLGGNATPVGASANVVMVGLAARSGHRISFWTFTKYGLVVASTTIFVAWIYVALRYFTFE